MFEIFDMKKNIEKISTDEGNISTFNYVLYLIILFLALPIIAGILLIWFKF